MPSSVRRLRRRRPESSGRLALWLLVVSLLTSCGGGDSRSLGDIVRDAAAEAQERVTEATGDVRTEGGGSGGEQAPIRNDTQTAFRYGQYQQLVRQVLASLEAYWAQAMPRELDSPYPGDPQRYVYYRSGEAPGPSCGDQQAPARNAFYCPPGDFIAWDETGLLIPYYRPRRLRRRLRPSPRVRPRRPATTAEGSTAAGRHPPRAAGRLPGRCLVPARFRPGPVGRRRPGRGHGRHLHRT